MNLLSAVLQRLGAVVGNSVNWSLLFGTFRGVGQSQLDLGGHEAVDSLNNKIQFVSESVVQSRRIVRRLGFVACDQPGVSRPFAE